MDLIRNNEAFDKVIDFQGGVHVKQVARIIDGGTLTCLALEDKYGNVVQIQAGQYTGLDVYTRRQVKRYKLHGTVDGCRIEQLFDDEAKARIQLHRFQQLAEHSQDVDAPPNVDLQVEEVLVADN